MSDAPTPPVTLAGYADTPMSLTSVAGWARVSDGGKAKIIAVYDAKTVALTTADKPRVDVGDCAYLLELPAPFNVLHVSSGELPLYAAYKKLRYRLNPVQPIFHERCIEQAVYLLSQLGPHAHGDSLPRAAAPPLPPRFAPGVRRTQESMFRVMPGQVSADDTTVVGYDGCLFIYRGSNDFVGQHALPVERVTELTAFWSDLFARRKTRAEAAGAAFVQVLIPEKSTVHLDRFPIPFEGPTPLYGSVVAGARAALGDALIDAHPVLLAAPVDERFLDLDSHLKAQGSGHVFAAIAAHLGVDPPVVRDWRPVVGSGDLTIKFPGLHVVADQLRPSADEEIAFAAAVELIEDSRPPNQHLNWTVHWRRKQPEDPRRVLCFCNSFFSTGHAPEQLTWWFAQTFAETRFVWNPDVVWEEVERFKPDVIVAQTIERFLPIMPEH